MKAFQFDNQKLVYLAGLAQIALAIGSLAIPTILNWKFELSKTRLLIKQMFWVYAAYIFVINLSFGVISVFNFNDLTSGSHLSLIIDGFIAVYWISRVAIQFFYFDRSDFPKGRWNMVGEVLLVMIFIFLSIVYTGTCFSNYIKS